MMSSLLLRAVMLLPLATEMVSGAAGDAGSCTSESHLHRGCAAIQASCSNRSELVCKAISYCEWLDAADACKNGIKDGNETGIDCGGSCPDSCGHHGLAKCDAACSQTGTLTDTQWQTAISNCGGQNNKPVCEVQSAQTCVWRTSEVPCTYANGTIPATAPCKCGNATTGADCTTGRYCLDAANMATFTAGATVAVTAEDKCYTRPKCPARLLTSADIPCQCPGGGSCSAGKECDGGQCIYPKCPNKNGTAENTGFNFGCTCGAGYTCGGTGSGQNKFYCDESFSGKHVCNAKPACTPGAEVTASCTCGERYNRAAAIASVGATCYEHPASKLKWPISKEVCPTDLPWTKDANCACVPEPDTPAGKSPVECKRGYLCNGTHIGNRSPKPVACTLPPCTTSGATETKEGPTHPSGQCKCGMAICASKYTPDLKYCITQSNGIMACSKTPQGNSGSGGSGNSGSGGSGSGAAGSGNSGSGARGGGGSGGSGGTSTTVAPNTTKSDDDSASPMHGPLLMLTLASTFVAAATLH